MGRRERNRELTRARLLAAALDLMGTKGPDGTGIAEITEQADVGFGTFYSYFESKDAILAAALEDVAEQLAATISSATSSIEDPAAAVAALARHLVTWAGENPSSGRFLVEVGLARDAVRRHLGVLLARQCDRGVQSGRFDARSADTAKSVVGGAVRATIAAWLDGHLHADPGPALAAQILLSLGLPSEEAWQLAEAPLPPLTTPSTSQRTTP
ncbi:MAG: hypothetical protein AVDCRST_MAG50-997 [uncultured Acidimicrobiales bacterium]|uniref:HTH tetR-type domain-containing protein n=1 Tax=uncultured Acidimicrobiales bacterium TaxID=310071 RepID=A0A6J4GYD2_9ACTN|nr:MAG: hypothetical protein AVDCRST_MAG50-997 [uncultured Acidimicrobiales bacterium]